jgi:H+-transporting ATPase
VDDVLRELGTSRDSGLTSAAATTRLEQYGPNEIDEKEEPVWRQILRRFWGPIPWMIEIAALLSAAVQKWEDFIIITIMLLVNGGIDFAQEHRAMNAVKALKQRLALQALVLRDGRWLRLAASELVPGDIVKLEIGDIVPADLMLLDGDYVLIDQSAMTGESLPISKGSSEVAYANTIVKQGEMSALVVNTGVSTNFSSMVALVATAQLEERSHFQKMVTKIGDFLIGITVVLVLLIIMIGVFRHEDVVELLRFSLVLTVAAIPVALPAVLSVTMAVGAMSLARHKVILRRLVAIEELAGVDVLCSDKTGTLTKNEMRVAEPVVFDGHDEKELFLFAALASREEHQDPIELPIFNYIEEHFPDLDWRQYEQVHFVPFDPSSKRTVATVQKDGVRFEAIKGAPQVLIKLANLDAAESHLIEGTVLDLAKKGYRTLAVATQRDDDVDLIGLIPLIDPPREDSAEVIRDILAHGISVKMVTGDNIAIAREIGAMLGLTGRAYRTKDFQEAGSRGFVELARVLTRAIYQKLAPDVPQEEAKRFSEEIAEHVSEQFQTEGLTKSFITAHESEIIETIEAVDVFAEVIPEDKYTLVSMLQNANHIVAMTGDGVNDAPALKKADAGIAVSNATDAARAAADLVLTAPGLAVIGEAIKQARITFERMKSYSIFRIAETLRIILFMTLAIVIFSFYPITALMIIILALLNDIPILAIAYDNTRVDENPVRWNMPEVLTVASVLGIAGVLSSFLLFYILIELEYSVAMIQSMFFAKLVIAGHGTIYNTRNKDWFWKKPYPSWTLFGATFSTRILGTLIAVYGIFITPIGWEEAALMWAYALAWFVFNDAIKMATYRVLRKRGIST